MNVTDSELCYLHVKTLRSAACQLNVKSRAQLKCSSNKGDLLAGILATAAQSCTCARTQVSLSQLACKCLKEQRCALRLTSHCCSTRSCSAEKSLFGETGASIVTGRFNRQFSGAFVCVWTHTPQQGNLPQGLSALIFSTRHKDGLHVTPHLFVQVRRAGEQSLTWSPPPPPFSFTPRPVGLPVSSNSSQI